MKDIRRPRFITFDPLGNGYVTNRDSQGIYIIDKPCSIKEFVSKEVIKSSGPLRGILYLSNRLLAVSDPISSRIILFSPTEKKVSGFINLPKGAYPDSLVENKGSLYISDTINCIIYEVEICSRNIVRTFGSKENMKSPRGMCLLNETLFVADRDDNSIAIIDLKTKKISHKLSYGRGNGFIRKPTDIKIINKSIFINDGDNYLIQVFDTDLNFTGQVGGKGPKIGQLDLAASMCVHNNMLYVCDRHNDRVVHFDPNDMDFNIFVPSVFEKGLLRRPFSACIDDKDNIYVADRDNDCIQIYNNKGEFANIIAPFDRPSAVAVQNDSTYILERAANGSSSLCKLKNNNKEYAQFPSPLNHARDMSIDMSGNIYISDTYNRKIIKLDNNMKTLASFDMANISGNQKVQIKCIAIEGEVLYAADFDSFSIHKLNLDGNYFGTISLKDKVKNADKLRSVSIINDHFIACVKGDNQVHILDKNGKLLRSFGRRGSSNYEFHNPTKAIKMHCEDILLVDKENDRICRFDKDWDFKSTIGNH